MAVTYGFFDSRSGDRKYNAQQMTEFYDGIVTEGVFQHKDGGLAVTAGTGLSVSVASGRAIVQNRWLKNDAAMTLQISAASETYARKDAVVIRLNTSARTISILVKTGTPAASPTAPSMTRSGSTYEMALAYVNVAAGATSVTVTDKRSDSAVCGWAAVAQATSGEVDQMLTDMKTGFDGVVYPSPAAMVQGCDQKIVNAISQAADQYDNMIVPIRAEMNGFEWGNGGSLVNSLTDTKTFFQLRVNTISASGGSTYINGEDVTEPKTIRYIGYCTPSAKYIQIRHNGSARDLIAKIPINVEVAGEFILTMKISATAANTVNGINISDICMKMFATSKWSASVAEGHHLIIPNDSYPVIETSSTGVSVKIKVSESDSFTDLPNSGSTKTIASVLTDLPDNAVWANGYLTITIANTQALIYDFRNHKFLISSFTSNSFPEQNSLVLIANWYGNFYGDWVNHASMKKGNIRPDIYLGNGTGLSYTNRLNGTVDVYIKTSISVILENGSTMDFSKSDIVDNLGSAAVIENDSVKITIGAYRGLFFDAIQRKLVLTSAGVNSQTVLIPLLYNGYGNISGPFLQYYLRNKVSEFDSNFGNIEQFLSLPSYYSDEVNETANKLAKLPINNFNYLIFTDIHYSYPSVFTSSKLKQLMESIDLLGNGSNIDAVVFLGDAIEGGYEKDRTTSDNQLNAVFEGLRNIKKPVLCSFGNHDNNMYNWNSAPTEDKTIDHYITPTEWKNKAVMPFGIDSDVYYKDFPKKNIRVIVANTCDYDPVVSVDGNVTISNYSEIMIRKPQLDEIADMMDESVYDMVILTHGLAEDLFTLIKKFNDRDTWTKDNGSVLDFSGKTTKVILYHTGHYHNEAMEHNDSFNVNIIATSCACMAPEQETLYSANNTQIVTSWVDHGPVAYNDRVIPRILNTINETCFDIVSIGNGKINKIGFGASGDGTLNI